MISQDALDFYNKNKDITWKLPELPSINDNIKLAEWILNRNDIGWIELDVKIDLAIWKLESKEAEKHFVDHRGVEHPGWNSCCIHGIDIDKTGAFTNYGYNDESKVPYHWTELSERVPTITEFWKRFPKESYRRIRFMELEAHGYISPHSDMPGNLPGEQGVSILEHGAPVNVAIIHPENCHMVVENFGIVPFVEGKMFMINIRNYHSVINFSNQNRIHMIAHGRYGNKKQEFADLLVNSYKKQYERERI